MADNLRHAQYSDGGIQVDSPQQLQPAVQNDNILGPLTSLLQTPGLALMGDSIHQQATQIVGGTYTYMARGAWCWAMCYSGWPWSFEPRDNYAVFGASIDAVIANQLPIFLANLVARNYKFCALSLFTNDTNAGLDATGLETLKGKALWLFRQLKQAGVTPILHGVKPRGTDGSLTNAKKQNADINDWLYQVSMTGLIWYIPTAYIYADLSTAFGNALTALMYDSGTFNLHPNCTGARLEGKAIADAITAAGYRPNIHFASQQSDVYDGTYNRTGVMFNAANPLLQGTTGTLAGGALGQVPTGMTGTAGTWSKVNRALVNGQNRTDALCAAATALTSYHLYDDWVGPANGGWIAGQPEVGMYMESRAIMVLDTLVAVTSAELRLAENNGGGALTNYCLFHSETSTLSGNHTLYLKTPRVPIRTYNGSGQVSLFSRAQMDTGAGGSGNMTIQQLEVRPISLKALITGF